MAFAHSFSILVLLLIIGLINAASKQRRDVIVHEGQCPSNNFPIHIHCRRRVCRPEELIPLCKDDGDCSTTQKCCRPLCLCRTRCVDAITQQE